jgi:SAM-dependent methyltransferase
MFRWDDISKAPLHDFPIRDGILCQFLPFTRDMSVLEIGPGSGFTAFWLSPFLAKMTVLDVTPEVIVNLRRQLKDVPNLSFCSRNLSSDERPLRTEGDFDAVFALDVFEYVPKPEVALRNLSATLRPGGELFLTFPNVPPPVGDGITYFESAREIAALLDSAGFRQWEISTVRKRPFARAAYELLHEWPIKAMRALRARDGASRPQTYEATWAFKKRRKLERAKPVLHFYWIILEYALRLGGPVFEIEPASDRILGRQTVVRAWK